MQLYNPFIFMMQETHQELADKSKKFVVEFRRECDYRPVVVAVPKSMNTPEVTSKLEAMKVLWVSLYTCKIRSYIHVYTITNLIHLFNILIQVCSALFYIEPGQSPNEQKMQGSKCKTEMSKL